MSDEGGVNDASFYEINHFQIGMTLIIKSPSTLIT